MSWNATYSSKAEFEANAPSFESCSKEPQVQDQVEIARSVAKLVIESGAIGNAETKEFAVSISGHANPEHEKKVGYANDCISVSVYQK
jgi:hypothetical protein